MTNDQYYQVGGSLPPNSPTYVKRQADEDFYQGLKAGQFCYVLTSRQMGKSSLQLRTMQRLQAEGVACAAIDLSEIGNWDVTQNQWYAGIIYSLVNNLELGDRIDLRNWWREREFLSPVQRLSEFIEKVLLVEVTEKIAIFVDEIDSVLSLNFPIDDFFAFIRACYNKRAENPEYLRLTFALLGVATPADLIEDKSRTPFNIGKAIQLKGFKLDEAQPLAVGFTEEIGNSQILLAEILAWTGGQPFLTQKVCQLITSSPLGELPISNSQFSIAEIIRSHIVENWEVTDEPKHLKTIRDRLLRNEQRTGRLLGLYQQILQTGEITADRSSEQTELQLSGLIIKQQGKLKVANRIYAAVFNRNWVENILANRRPYAESFAAWLASDCQDESRLLRGKALQDALDWMADRSLSDRDYQFLTASQELDRQQVQIALDAERKANLILAEAQRKANRTIKRGIAILAILSTITAAAIWQAGQAIREEWQGLKLESKGMNALRMFESQSGEEIKALLSAMDAGQDLKAIVKSQRNLAEYPAISPILALQTILDKIRDRNHLKGQASPAFSVIFSSDGKRIATIGDDNIVRIWNRSGNLITNIKASHSRLQTVNFINNGRQIATADTDGKIQLWHPGGKPISAKFTADRGKIRTVTFSPQGNLVAAIAIDGTLRLSNLSGKQLFQLNAKPGEFRSINFSPNGQQLATTSVDGKVKIWNLSGKLVHEFNSNSKGLWSLNFSPDGQRIATTSADGRVRIWNLVGKQLAQINSDRGGVWSVSFSPDGQRIATTGADGSVRLWDRSGQQLDKFNSHQGQVLSVSFSPQAKSKDGLRIATAGDDGIVRLADLWDLPISRSVARGKQLLLKDREFWRVSLSPNSQYIATANSNGMVRIWDESGKTLISEFRAHQSWVLSLTFSRDGRLIATSGNDGIVRIWNCPSGEKIAEFKSDRGQVRSMSFSPDSKQIATAGDDGKVQLWNLFGKPLSLNFQAYESRVWSLSFSPDGRYIVTAGDDSNVKIWNRNGKIVTQFNSEQGEVRSMSFSPDGQRLATAGADGTVKLWVKFDRPSGQLLLAQFKAQTGDIFSVSFSADGKSLAAAGSDSTIGIWRVEELDELLQRGCNWLKDYLATHREVREKLKACKPENSN